MPWFLTSIYIESAQKWDKRTFGFYNNYNDAIEAIKENCGNMVECLYDYLVLEYIEEGIHPEVHKEEWFKYDERINGWFPAAQPLQFLGVTNWALG